MLGVIKECGRIGSLVLRGVAKISRQRQRVYNLAGIKNPIWIGRVFNGAERVIEGIAKHPANEGSAQQTIAVLAGKRAAKLEHEFSTGIGDGFKLLQPFLSF